MRRPCNHQNPATPSQKKPEYHEVDDQDRISMLPEPILHHILSYHPTKDATRTCVLSKTFNSTWKSFPILEFDQYPVETYIRKNRETQKISTIVQDFCKYVNKTISNREGALTSISKFRVKVNFYTRNISNSHRKDLNSWLNFAIDNKFRDLHLSHYASCKDIQWHRHVLPESLFHAKSLENLYLFGCQFTRYYGSFGLCLKILKLSWVYINQETLQGIVSTSRHLEELRISFCKGFQSIKVSGANRRSVDIDLATDQVQTVVISAPNLKFLSYSGGCANVQSSLAGSNNFQSLKEFIYCMIWI